MEKEILLTVIVPVYNIENYIETSLQSLVNQSFADFEVIIVDDNSNDKTSKIVSEFSEKYSNLTVLKNKINKGVSYSRNRALELVNTKYVSFLDGDDWLDSNAYSKAINTLEKDITIDFVLWNINTAYTRSHCEKRYFYDQENIINSTYALKLFTKSLNSNIYISPLLGNKVFRTGLIQKNNIRFNGYFYEDDVFTFYCLIYSKNIKIITDTNLYYFQRDGSAMRSFSEAVIDDFFSSYIIFRQELIYRDLWNGNEEYYYSYYEKCLQNLILQIRNSSKTEKEERNYYGQLMSHFYTFTPFQEYLSYCDLRLFPL